MVSGREGYWAGGDFNRSRIRESLTGKWEYLFHDGRLRRWRWLDLRNGDSLWLAETRCGRSRPWFISSKYICWPAHSFTSDYLFKLSVSTDLLHRDGSSSSNLDSSLESMTSHRSVLGYILLSRSTPASIIRHSGSVFEGEQGKKYATAIKRMADTVQAGLEDISGPSNVTICTDFSASFILIFQIGRDQVHENTDKETRNPNITKWALGVCQKVYSPILDSCRREILARDPSRPINLMSKSLHLDAKSWLFLLKCTLLSQDEWIYATSTSVLVWSNKLVQYPTYKSRQMLGFNLVCALQA